MDEIALFGRQGDRDAVMTSEHGFVLVVGDSGIGKSSFLSSLTTWTGQPLVSSPIVLKSVEGSLQTALADAISDCMAQYLGGANDIRTVWKELRSIADRAKTITGREIGHAVLARILTYAESKLGEEVVDIGKKVLGDIAKGGRLGFDDQLAAIRIPDRARELCDIAAGLSEVVGRPLILLLDNVERLAPSDHGLMVELVDAVVGEVRVVACVTPHHKAGDAIIQDVSIRGTEPHELRPLARPDIEAWLTAEHVPPPRWDTITRLSSGYPFFIDDAVRLSRAGASLDEIAAPNGFDALMRAAWKSIPEGIRATAARLAPFAEPPSEDFLLKYLGFDLLQWDILTQTLLESGIFVRRSDGAAWFHDRRRTFIWETVLGDKPRMHVAREAFAAVASWVDTQSHLEFWVPSATAVLARATGPTSAESLIPDLLTLPDEGIALLWGLIEVIEPGSVRIASAEIGEVVRHAEARSGQAINALATMTQLEERGLIRTEEAHDVRLVRSNLGGNTNYAALLGEIQLRFHTTPRPHLASAAFDAFVRPVMGSFDAAVISLGRSTLINHKEQSKLLSDPRAIGHAGESLPLGATVVFDGQQLSFTARFSSHEMREKAREGLLTIDRLNSRVRVDRVFSLPQPRLRYARYGLAAESIDDKLRKMVSPTPDEYVEYLDLRAKYSEALGMVSTPDEIEVLNLGHRRFLVDIRATPGSWTSFEVRTDRAQPTRDISELRVDPRDPLLELQLRAEGYLVGGERIARVVTRFGQIASIPHPLTTVLKDIEDAGKAYNSGLRGVLIAPDSELLEREIRSERQRLSSVVTSLESVNVDRVSAHRNSLLVGFWDEEDGGLMSDFGNWYACALEVDDGQGDVAVRRLQGSPFESSSWPRVKVPKEFVDHAGAVVTNWRDGVADSIVGRLLGYGAHDARMTDLDSPLGKILRNTHEIIGESGDTT